MLANWPTRRELAVAFWGPSKKKHRRKEPTVFCNFNWLKVTRFATLLSFFVVRR